MRGVPRDTKGKNRWLEEKGEEDGEEEEKATGL